MRRNRPLQSCTSNTMLVSLRTCGLHTKVTAMNQVKSVDFGTLMSAVRTGCQMQETPLPNERNHLDPEHSESDFLLSPDRK